MANGEAANEVGVNRDLVTGELDEAEQVETDGRTPGEWLALVATAPRYWTQWLWVLPVYTVLLSLAIWLRPDPGAFAGFVWCVLFPLGTLYSWWKVGSLARSKSPQRWHARGVRVIRLDRRWWRPSLWQHLPTAVVARPGQVILLSAMPFRNPIDSLIPIARIQWFAVSETRPRHTALVVAVDPRGAEGSGLSGHGAMLLRLKADVSAVRAALIEIGVRELTGGASEPAGDHTAPTNHPSELTG